MRRFGYFVVMFLLCIGAACGGSEGCPEGQSEEFSHNLHIPQPRGGVIVIPQFECRS